jgi:hypothetical protein
MKPKQMKIDEGGYLWIERFGKMIEQFCPFSYDKSLKAANQKNCGDWCPLFDDSNIIPNGQGDLGLCKREYYDVEIKDERKYI